MHRNWYWAVGGGLGDCIYSWFHEIAPQRIESLAKDYGARIRIYTLCHNDGVLDLFTHNPFVAEHVFEHWHPPTAEDNHRFSNPIGDYWPLGVNRFIAEEFGGELSLNRCHLYLSENENRQLAGLLDGRPVVVVQPFAGLSDRDAFNSSTLQSLVDNIVALEKDTRIVIVGKNHIRGHKYTQEIVGFTHPNVVDLIDRTSIRFNYHLVKNCDAFCGAHSNLILTAWDWRRRNALVMPSPMMTDHWPKLDAKYRSGTQFPETRIFTFPFGEGVPRHFEGLDTQLLAAFLLGRA